MREEAGRRRGEMRTRRRAGKLSWLSLAPPPSRAATRTARAPRERPASTLLPRSTGKAIADARADEH
jgi:hypothetical protein